ncbi:MAG: Veg family protein [Tissierellia bacterium]|nr:Veg family protein [Tissierellia bacterium]
MNQMESIKKELSKHIGKRVIVKADKGRKRIVTRKGILEAVYPSLFIVSVVEENLGDQKISYTYSDLLTSVVRIAIVEDNVDMGDVKISS